MTMNWNIKHPIHGAAEILPNTIRYGRAGDQRHPYGWQLSFWATIRKTDGTTARTVFGGLGTNRRAAMANALPR